MIIIYIICLLAILTAISAIIPLIQFFYRKIKTEKKIIDYRFPIELFNHAITNNSLDNIEKKDIISREKIMMRGTIRGENAISLSTFEKMKKEEYNIPLTKKVNNEKI